jgi:hypothetical protein
MYQYCHKKIPNGRETSQNFTSQGLIICIKIGIFGICRNKPSGQHCLCCKIRLCLFTSLFMQSRLSSFHCPFQICPVHSQFNDVQCTHMLHVHSLVTISLSPFLYKKMPHVCKYIQSFTRVQSVQTSIESGYVYQHLATVLLIYLPGVDVMITIFCDFSQFSAEKICVFLKYQCYDHFFQKFSLF